MTRILERLRWESVAGRLSSRRLRRPREAERAGPCTEHQLAHLSAEDRRIVEHALPYTMTGVPRLQALIDGARHCERRGIPGSFVECGVWRGGSILAMILVLQELGAEPRDIYLFDTFEGMTKPTEHDVSKHDPPALQDWRQAEAEGGRPWSELFGAEQYDESSVREALLATGYPPERLHLVKGAVEETLPAQAPGELALLRLDTDWYESTLHELVHLYPRLVDGGVLVLDDYGHWEGARRAVDEYFGERSTPLLTRIDYTGRIGVKY